jgi:hypothetical protein
MERDGRNTLNVAYRSLRKATKNVDTVPGYKKAIITVSL